MTFGDSVKIKVPLQTIKKSRLKKRGTPLDPRYLGIRRILYRKSKNTIQKSGLYNFNHCTYSQPHNKALWMGKDSPFQACFGVCGETTKNKEESKIVNVP